MNTLRRSITLGSELLAQPRKAVDRIMGSPDAALLESGCLFVVYCATAVLFYALKPDSFPPPPQELGPFVGERGLLFWGLVQLWSVPLMALLIVATAWFGQLLAGKRLPIRLFVAIVTPVVPFVLLVLYSAHKIPGWGFLLGLAAMAGVAVPGFLRIERPDWRPLSSALLAVNFIPVALLPLFTGAVLLRSVTLYHVLEFGALIWMLGVSCYGVSRVLRLGIARAFWAVFLALVCQILLVLSFYMLGALPKEVLKALLAV